MLLKILQWAFATMVLVAFIVEVAVPFVQGRRLFPSFRRNPTTAKLAERRMEATDLEETLEATDDLIDVTDRQTRLQRELREAETELEQARNPKPTQPPTP